MNLVNERIQFYQARINDGIEYIAASSERAARNFLSLVNGPYPFELRKVSEDEAAAAPYYSLFSQRRRLCRDGTWVLGYVH